MQEKEWRLAAWFSIPPTLHSLEATSLKCSVPFCFIYYVIEFSKSADPSCTFKHIGAPVKILGLFSTARSSLPAPVLFVQDVSLGKTACILSALELHFSCIESAVGLHRETSGAAKVSWITEL